MKNILKIALLVVLITICSARTIYAQDFEAIGKEARKPTGRAPVR